jgi:xanthine dehydrogenase FAD-binding subunit
MMTVDFKFVSPKDEKELKEEIVGENVFLMAGGTDLLVKMRAGRVKPSKIVSTLKVPSLHKIEFDGKILSIGSNVTYSELLDFKPLKDEFEILHDVISTIGSPQIRNRGTLVGNVMNASPAGDGLLALYLLDTEIELSDGRTLGLKEFITGPGRTVIEKEEYVKSIKIKKEKWTYHYFEKVGQRTSMTISIASLGWLMRMDGEHIEEMRLAFGSVAPTVLRMEEIENFSHDKNFDRSFLNDVAKKVFDGVKPIDDVRGSALYRKRVCRNLMYRLVKFVQ